MRICDWDSFFVTTGRVGSAERMSSDVGEAEEEDEDAEEEGENAKSAAVAVEDDAE